MVFDSMLGFAVGFFIIGPIMKAILFNDNSRNRK